MFASVLVRLKALVFRKRADQELDEELRYHLDRETERNVANGMSPNDAHFAAQRALGNLTVASGQARDAQRWRFLEELMQDATYAIRTCRRAPVFVFTVVGTIGLGLGLLVTAFTLFDAYVLRPVAVRDPGALYDIAWRTTKGGPRQLTWTQFKSLARQHVFDESFADLPLIARLRGRPALGQLVSGNYFRSLGVSAELGRTLEPDDSAAPGSGAVIVISHEMWASRFGGDSSVVGQTVVINATRLRVVGVAREGFGGMESVTVDFWLPITMTAAVDPSRDLFATPEAAVLRVVGRVPPNTSVDVTRTKLFAWLSATMSDALPDERVGGVTLESRRSSIALTPDVIAAFTPIAIAFLLVMLIACANVANVMLARGMARQREIGVRLALGAGRARLIRQLLTESLLLSVPAALLGYVVSRAAITIGVDVMYATTPLSYRAYVRPLPLTVDMRIVTFTMLAGVLAAIVFGLAPALQITRPAIVRATKGDFDSHLRPSKLRNGLVVAQIAASSLLLICAGLLLRAARDTKSLAPGIRTQNVLQIRLLDRGRGKAIDALRSAPEVSMIASASMAPLNGIFRYVFTDSSASAGLRFNVVSPAYFAAIDLPIRRGRGFTEAEALGRVPVAVVSEAAGGALWPGLDPIGQRIRLTSRSVEDRGLAAYRTATVIGVVPNAVPGWIGMSPLEPVVYYPQPVDAPSSAIIVRSASDGERARASLERLLTAADSVALQEIHTLDAGLAIQVLPFQISYWIASLIGGVALLLTLTGVYGVLSYVVAQRMKELGIRSALGAARASLIGLVVGQMARVAVVALAIGTVLGLGVSRIFASLLPVIDMYSLGGYATGIGVVLAACMLAAYLPARRAAAADPVEALRADS